MIVGGPSPDRTAALESLELIADTYLSVGTPVQIALPHLLRAGASVRSAIHDRIRHNLAVLRTATAAHPSCDVLRAEGGWAAIVRIPSIQREEDLVLNLLEHEQILVYPGYFFDFPRESHLVVSLLPPPGVFSDAVNRVLRFVTH
jgi:aspartate/methionine/tyrosine aminotransferase